MLGVRIFLLVFFLALEALSYRYICNGLLANGEERSDECGICDEEHAARWGNPNIPVLVDLNPRPDGISESDWDEIVNESLKAWNDIDGSNLRFFRTEATNPREFGANDGLHELFWITDKEEWRFLVGSGEFGTLGATLPRYLCGGELGSYRRIFDADLVLNGLSHINWQVDCDNDDCISIQTTLVHELGHFFGLDHPCLVCSTSVMSARAGFDLKYPVFDDIDGLLSLYPSGSTGGFGFPCNSDDDCAASNFCKQQQDNFYCTHGCQSDSDCESGATCIEESEKSACEFIDQASAGGRLEGESCSRVACVDPLVCAGAVSGEYFCYLPCESSSDCSGEFQCVNVSEELSVCIDLREKDEECNFRDLCEINLYCVFGDQSSGVCRAPCDANIDSCAADEVCQLFPAGYSACLPSDDAIVLGSQSDNFGVNPGVDRFGRGSGNSSSESPGCATFSGNPWLLLAFLIIWRTKRRRR